MQRWTIRERRAIGATALLMAFTGCVPLKDLSSYSEGADPEQSTSRGSPSPGSTGNPDASVQTNPTTLDEGNPADAPLEPAPASFDGNAPEPTEVTLGDAAAAPAPPAVDAADECAANGGFTISETSSCYLVGDTTFTWQDARDLCQAWGGDLVQIDSAEENAQLVQRAEDTAWIGATDQFDEGTFRWAGGDLLDYTEWLMGQPNNLAGLEDCAELRTIDSQWADVPCTDDIARQALCERPLSD
jgi:hypothetical protein